MKGERNRAIANTFLSGRTMAECAARFGLSVHRIKEILDRQGARKNTPRVNGETCKMMAQYLSRHPDCWQRMPELFGVNYKQARYFYLKVRQ